MCEKDTHFKWIFLKWKWKRIEVVIRDHHDLIRDHSRETLKLMQKFANLFWWLIYICLVVLLKIDSHYSASRQQATVHQLSVETFFSRFCMAILTLSGSAASEDRLSIVWELSCKTYRRMFRHRTDGCLSLTEWIVRIYLSFLFFLLLLLHFVLHRPMYSDACLVASKLL